MSDAALDPTNERQLFRAPPPPTAAFSFTPDFFIAFHVRHYPNALRRFMQWWLLGIYWKRL